ncbi:hypothetical protein ILYODFUR_022067 [Ilyodon furcidens]|uniref:Uncharacterized protein n=1 Tax=Ilyodon furcidens TaxID=33524 RepID=A0ABV0VG24_9TELE
MKVSQMILMSWIIFHPFPENDPPVVGKVPLESFLGVFFTGNYRVSENIMFPRNHLLAFLLPDLLTKLLKLKDSPSSVPQFMSYLFLLFPPSASQFNPGPSGGELGPSSWGP